MARTVAFNEEAAIQKAMQVFWEKGYNGASMRDLTAAMQINASSLYNTIGDKQQLFFKCIDHYTHTQLVAAQQQAANTASPLQAIIDIINGSVETIAYSSNSCLGIKTTFEVATTDAAVRDLMQKHDDEFLAFLQDLFKRAMSLGELSAQEDPEMLADFIFNAFTGWHESYILHRNPLKIKKMADYLVRQITK
jgi:TetR/AcrR family transcriptional repressor of nem operon